MITSLAWEHLSVSELEEAAKERANLVFCAQASAPTTQINDVDGWICYKNSMPPRHIVLHTCVEILRFTNVPELHMGTDHHLSPFLN